MISGYRQKEQRSSKSINVKPAGVRLLGSTIVHLVKQAEQRGRAQHTGSKWSNCWQWQSRIFQETTLQDQSLLAQATCRHMSKRLNFSSDKIGSFNPLGANKRPVHQRFAQPQEKYPWARAGSSHARWCRKSRSNWRQQRWHLPQSLAVFGQHQCWGQFDG